MSNFRRFALLFLSFAAAALASGLTGDWKGNLDTPQGTVQVSYTFKQNGDALTGTWQTAQTPTVEISDGKVNGDKLSFVVKIGSLTLGHEGTVKGDEIQITMKPSGEFPGATVVAKRVQK